MPPGREATWRDFAARFARQQQAFRGIEGHQAFEEIRGVVTADADGVLTREQYRTLGVRQSIFPQGERDRLYELSEKYRAWLEEAGLYDLNLIAHAWRDLAAPRHDFIVVDEVQDLTIAQLALVLHTLKKPGYFLLCGDSNQIVHPNFFSGSKVKSLFWRDPTLAEAFRNAGFARGPFAALYELIAPAAVDVKAGERLVRIDRHLSEYLLFQTLWALFKSRFVGDGRGVFDTAAILEAWKHLPAHVLRPERNKRQHLSGVLARNEVDRDYAYNRALFKRVRTGWYQFNPALAVRRRVETGEAWVPVFDALNLPLVKEFAEPYCWRAADEYLNMAGGAPAGVPVAGERWWAERQAEDAAARARVEKEERERRRREKVLARMEKRRLQRIEQARALRAQANGSARAAAKPAPWGTPQARQAEIERIRRQIEENAARRAGRDKDGEPE